MISLPSRLKEIEIPHEKPFANDKLGMEKYAATLKSVIEMYAENGGVIALNGDWGTGKTTFSKMWKAYLENNGLTTIYFNAWETDYFKDPLTAIVGELKDISKEDESFKTFCASAGRIGLSIAKSSIQYLLKEKAGIDSEVIKAALDGTETVLIDRIKAYEEEKASIADFKENLSKFVADAGATPLVFIIDELDRCNPHYAVKLLETIKHIFDVPNIVFVLSICRKELENSIKGYYGSESIDANNYLRRFIDLQFDMPKPEKDSFCNLLYNYYHFAEYFEEERDIRDIEDRFLDMAKLLFGTYRIDLRTWDRIFAHTRLTALQIGANNNVVVELIFFLCFLRITQADFYYKIRDKKYTVQGLIEAIENKIPRALLEKQDGYVYGRKQNRPFVLVISELLFIYDYTLNEKAGVIIPCKTNEDHINVSVSILDKDTIEDLVRWIPRAMNIDKDISFFTNKVDLAENFKD